MIIGYIEKQIAWSLAVFGPGRRTKGICEHIRLELNEVEAKPDDLEEWCDVIILALDGAWRAGYSPSQIVDALKYKQSRNFLRSYPKPVSEDHPSEHVRPAEPPRDAAFFGLPVSEVGAGLHGGNV